MIGDYYHFIVDLKSTIYYRQCIKHYDQLKYRIITKTNLHYASKYNFTQIITR